MSFEDDMIEAGFHDEGNYLDYICDKSDRELSEQQDYSRGDESELECQRELYEEKVEHRKKLKQIYHQFDNWRTNFPHEIDIYKGDSRNAEIFNEYSPELETWLKWKINREQEDKLIKQAKLQLHTIKKLIDIDAISWGFNQFIHDQKIDSLIKIINKWKKDNPNFIHEYNSFDARGWSEHDFFQQKAIEEYIYIMSRRFCNYPTTIKECFLENNITPEDVRRFSEMRYKNLVSNTNKYNYTFNLDDIRKLELWVNSNHFLDWDNWARSNMNWVKYVRNGYAHMYQDVWWGKYENEKKYWECEDKAKPKEYSYNPEFKRRLIIRKLKHLHLSVGSIFNDNLAIFEDYDEYGFIDPDGNIIIEAKFDGARDFYNGLAAVKVDAKEFEKYIPEVDDYLTVKHGGKWGFIDTKGFFVIQPQYDILTPFKNGIAAYCKGAVLTEFCDTYIPNGGKWGIITQKGKELVSPTYDFIRLIGNNLAIANIGGMRDSTSAIFHNGLWCVLSRDGHELTPFKYTWISDYENDKAVVNLGGFCEEIEGGNFYYCYGQWGYIDENGCEIEPLKEYCNIEEFKKDWEDTH